MMTINTQGASLTNLQEVRVKLCSVGVELARPVGLEPTTTGLEIRCSIHLSYGREAAPSSYNETS